MGLGLFVDLDWGRFALWVVAMAAGALAFAALGLAIGTLTREVRAASLLAFMLALPLAFLALPFLADAFQVFKAHGLSVDLVSTSETSVTVSLDPAANTLDKPTLDALDAALNDAGGLGTALLHLAALVVGFGVLSRVALRRFAT